MGTENGGGRGGYAPLAGLEAARVALRFLILDETDEELRRYTGEGLAGWDEVRREHRDAGVAGLKSVLSEPPLLAPRLSLPPADREGPTEPSEPSEPRERGAPPAPADPPSEAEEATPGVPPGRVPRSEEVEERATEGSETPAAPEVGDHDEGGEPEKECRKCGPEKGPKPLSAFGFNRRTADGRAHTCSECLSESARIGAAAREGRRREGVGGGEEEDEEPAGPSPTTGPRPAASASRGRSLREQREAERKQREGDFLRSTGRGQDDEPPVPDAGVGAGRAARAAKDAPEGGGVPDAPGRSVGPVESAGGGPGKRPEDRRREPSKACEVCGPEAGPKPLTRFPKVVDLGAHPDGRGDVCRECRKGETPGGSADAGGRPELTGLNGTAPPVEGPGEPADAITRREAKRAEAFCVYGDRCVQPGIEGPVRLASDQRPGDPCSYCLRNNPGVVSAEDVERAKESAKRAGAKAAGERAGASAGAPQESVA